MKPIYQITLEIEIWFDLVLLILKSRWDERKIKPFEKLDNKAFLLLIGKNECKTDK